jgi:hypothetical protein
MIHRPINHQLTGQRDRRKSPSVLTGMTLHFEQFEAKKRALIDNMENTEFQVWRDIRPGDF